MTIPCYPLLSIIENNILKLPIEFSQSKRYFQIIALRHFISCIETDRCMRKCSVESLSGVHNFQFSNHKNGRIGSEKVTL